MDRKAGADFADFTQNPLPLPPQTNRYFYYGHFPNHPGRPLPAHRTGRLHPAHAARSAVGVCRPVVATLYGPCAIQRHPATGVAGHCRGHPGTGLFCAPAGSQVQRQQQVGHARLPGGYGDRLVLHAVGHHLGAVSRCCHWRTAGRTTNKRGVEVGAGIRAGLPAGHGTEMRGMRLLYLAVCFSFMLNRRAKLTLFHFI